MSGTAAGGRHARDTNKARYGENFYKKIGEAGGKISRGGAFSKDHEFAAIQGRKGGAASKRTKRATNS